MARTHARTQQLERRSAKKFPRFPIFLWSLAVPEWCRAFCRGLHAAQARGLERAAGRTVIPGTD